MSFNGGFPINQSVQWNERVILYTEQLMFSLPRAQRLKRNKVGPSSLAPKCGDVGCNHSTCLNHQKLQKKQFLRIAESGIISVGNLHRRLVRSLKQGLINNSIHQILIDIDYHISVQS